MRVITTLVVLAGFLHQILAPPSLAETDERAKEKRQFATATSSATTVQTTVTATVKPAGACSASTPIVKNGDFETGTLGPWELTRVQPPLPDYEQYLSVGVGSPGCGGSNNAFTVKDNAASSHVEVELSQQNVTVCAASQYKFAAQFYMTDAKAIPSPQTHVLVYVDGKLIASSKASDATGPPVVWLPLTGTFVGGSSTATLSVKFIVTDYLGVEWGLDDVVITNV
ncbi:MAG: hypothetical protein LQ337_000649 [Flavoplaca oasis]|nr:MAG: hypothetical protein LQ337_000649 [Flavoplaca oasis]